MKKLIYIFVLIVAFTSCVKDSNYETPQIKCDEPQIPANQIITIESAIEIWKAVNPTGTTMNLATLAKTTDNPTYISGYVTSSDETGNFYEEIYIQDSPDNPKFSIKILVEIPSYYTKYDLGRKIFLKVNGLAINKSHGEMVVGTIKVGDVDVISPNLAKNILFRSCTPTSLVAKPISIDQINSSLIGVYVKLDNMQFDLPIVGKPFVNPMDSYDSHRVMVSCNNGDELKLETSTFATFKTQIIPSGKGSVSGILTKDYGDDFYVLRVNNPSDFSFTGTRCGADLLGCSNSSAGNGSLVLFEQNFESFTINQSALPGWTNINNSGGTNLYQVKSFSNNKYMQYTAFSSSNPVARSEVWLVTPAINLDATTNEALYYKTATGYNNGAALSVYVSTDFAGNVNTATWKLLNGVLANGPSSGYQSTFTESGVVDISCLTGNVFVAFKYKGGTTSGVTTTFQIDDVKVTGKTP